MMGIEFIILFASITIIAFLLMMATLISFKKFGNKKLLFISLVLLFLFIRGLLLSLSLFNSQIADVVSSGYIWFFDLIVLGLLYLTYSIRK